MKKGKILKTLAIAGTCLCAPLLLSGCTSGNENKTDPQNFRVQDGWVQFTQDGETWVNLIEAEYPISEYDFRIHNGYVQWTTDGESWTNLIKVVKETCTITYDYGKAKDLFKPDAPQTSLVYENGWVSDLPEIQQYKNSFIGWFIQGTDKQIANYDYIAEDVTLEARFDFTTGPSGAYQNGKYVYTWQDLIDNNAGANNSIVVDNGVLTYGKSIYDLKIDDSVTEIGESAFDDGFIDGGIAIPDSVKRIGREAFMSQSLLTTVVIGNGVEIIEENAFWGCKGLTEIIIPKNVVLIEGGAFAVCDNLENISLDKETIITAKWKVYEEFSDSREVLSQDAFTLSNKQLAHFFKMGCRFEQVYQQQLGIEYIVFDNQTSILTEVLDKTKTEIRNIGIGLIEIADYALAQCKNVTEITIPDSVMRIGKYVFNTCDNLTTITFEEKDGYKWQVYENDAWRDAETSELFNLAKAGKELKRVAE